MRIGYLDDEYDVLKGAMRSLKKYDMEIIAMKNIDDVTNITMLTDAIISNSLECLLVDYDLEEALSLKNNSLDSFQYQLSLRLSE